MKMRSLLLFAIVVGCLMPVSAHAAPALCTITGTIFDGAGNPVPYANIYFNSQNTQVVNGTTIYPINVTSTTDVNGNLSTTTLQQGLFVQITICQSQGGGCAAPTTGFVPISSSTTFQNLLTGQAVVTGASLTGILNASGFRITNLGMDTTLGDALSRGQSTLNSLAAPNASYAMANHKLTGLGAGTASGDTFAFGLNDLSQLAAATGNYSMGSHRITGLAAPTTTGDALSEGNAIGGTTPASGTFTSLAAATVEGTAAVQTGSGAVLLLGGPIQTTSQLQTQVSGGTITPVLGTAADIIIQITDGGTWTLAAPTVGAAFGDIHWWIRILNTSGGTGGTITLNGVYRVDSSWSTVGPANGKTRVCPVLTLAGSSLQSYVGPCTGDETN